MTAPTRGRIRVEQSQRRIRTYFAGKAIADSARALLVWEKPYYPTYYFPVEDVAMDLLAPTGETKRSPSRGDATLHSIKVGERDVPDAAYSYQDSPIEELRGHIAFVWSAMDHWFEEDEEVWVHARDPYTRIDALKSSRHIEVMIDGTKVADSTNATILFETGLPARYYIPKTDVRMDLLSPTDLVTSCPYKGHARYWSVTVGDTVHENVVWGYDAPFAESAAVTGLVSFYNEKVDILVDGEPEIRPKTKFG